MKVCADRSFGARVALLLDPLKRESVVGMDWLFLHCNAGFEL